jgi:hypothetical protein
VPLALRGQSQGVNLAQNKAEIEVGLGDGFDVFAAHVTKVALVAESHGTPVCWR